MKTIRLLTIGNSFSQNALTYLEKIAETSGDVRFQVGRASLGGCSLEKHWNIADYTTRVSDYKTYNICTDEDGNQKQGSLQIALAADQWDFVTLQQVSRKSWLRDTYEPYLGKLLDMVKELAPTATPLLHQTWAYRTDSTFLPENGITQQIMFERIRDNFKFYSEKYGIGILRSGEAIQKARETQAVKFTWPEEGYAYKYAQAPELPKQTGSFAVGWHWAINNAPEGVPELRNDPNHLNARGNYLAGCVWYQTMTGLETNDNTYVPDEIDPADAAFLRDVAKSLF